MEHSRLNQATMDFYLSEVAVLVLKLNKPLGLGVLKNLNLCGYKTMFTALGVLIRKTFSEQVIQNKDLRLTPNLSVGLTKSLKSLSLLNPSTSILITTLI